jgi:flagellin-specific chaperone FliS
VQWSARERGREKEREKLKKEKDIITELQQKLHRER